MWRTDIENAPRGDDVLVALKTVSGEGEAVSVIGVLLWEPYERDGETDDECEGFFGDHEGKPGVWYWHCGDDGYTDRKYIAAWAPMPDPFIQGK